MNEPPKLSVVNGDAGTWSENIDQDARDTLERILADYDRVVVIGVRRCGRGEVEWAYTAGGRTAAHSSVLDLTGAMHVIVRQLEDET